MPISRFAGILCWQLIENAVLLSCSSVSRFAPPLSVPEAVPVPVISSKSSDGSNVASSISDLDSPLKVVILV